MFAPIELWAQPQVKKGHFRFLVGDAVKEFWHEKRGKWTDICSVLSLFNRSYPPSLPNAVFPFLFREIRSGYGFALSKFWSAGIGTRSGGSHGEMDKQGVLAQFYLSNPDLMDLTNRTNKLAARNKVTQKWIKGRATNKLNKQASSHLQEEM